MPLRDIFRRTKPAEEVRHTFKSPDKFSFLGSPASSGMEVSETSALGLTAVYSCVRIISESLAALPLITYRETEDGRRQATDLPIYSILRDQADPNLTSFMMIETIVSHACTYGNGYAYISRNNAGQVTGLTPLDPRYIDVKMTESGRVAYEITGGTVQGALTSEEVLHIRALGQVGLVGYSPIGLARETIGLGLAAEKYGAAYFGNSGTPSGILSVPGKMSDEAFQNLRRSWEKIHKGSGNSARVALLEAGIDFKPISITPNDAQFLETRRFQVAEIARIFRVPPSMLADLENAGSYGSIGELNRAFVVHTLTPWARRIESEIKSKLLPSAGGVYAEFSFDHLLRGDLETRFKAYQTGRQAGFLSANDIRAIEHLDPLGDIGDRYLTPLNMEALTPDEDPEMPEEIRSLEIRAVEDDRSRVREQTSPAMLDTLERLARLESRAASREHAKRDDTTFFNWAEDFFQGDYQRQAFSLILPTLETLARGLSFTVQDELGAEERIQLPEGTLEDLARRFATRRSQRSLAALRGSGNIANTIAGWKTRHTADILDDELRRAEGAIVLELFRAAGVEEIRWRSPEDSQNSLSDKVVALGESFILQGDNVTEPDGSDYPVRTDIRHNPYRTGDKSWIEAVR